MFLIAILSNKLDLNQETHFTIFHTSIKLGWKGSSLLWISIECDFKRNYNICRRLPSWSCCRPCPSSASSSGGASPSWTSPSCPTTPSWKTSSGRSNQGILKGDVSLYRWPPVWLVWNQLVYCQILIGLRLTYLLFPSQATSVYHFR